MTTVHDEVEIEDFEYNEEEEVYYYPCPCGDRFQIGRDELAAGEEFASCPSCSLIIKVIYDKIKKSRVATKQKLLTIFELARRILEGWCNFLPHYPRRVSHVASGTYLLLQEKFNAEYEERSTEEETSTPQTAIKSL